MLGGCDTPIPTEITATESGADTSGKITDGFIPIADIDDEQDVPSDYPVTINDTVINKRPATAVCLSSSLAEIIYELGYGDRLIGRGSYCDWPEEIKSLTDYGKPAAPDIDALKRTAPDVLITATAVPNIDIKALNEYGIAVVYIPSPRTVDEFGRIYCALGMIFDGMFDGEEKGNNVFSGIREELENSGITLGSFIYITEGLTIAGGDTFESTVLSMFGNNAAEALNGYYSGDSGDIQPDTVIVNAALDIGAISADPVLSKLDAVKNGRIIKINNRYFESPSGRITAIIKELQGTEGVGD
jgi:iron complex transport system substrate-binding protein